MQFKVKSNGILFINAPQVTCKRISKRSETPEEIFEKSLAGLSTALEHAQANNLTLVVSGGLVRDAKEFKVVSELIRLLSKYDAPFVMLNDSEFVKGQMSDNSVIGILSAANLIVPVTEKSALEFESDDEAFECLLLPCSENMPRRFASKKVSSPEHRLVIANHLYSSKDSFRDIASVGTVIVPEFTAPFESVEGSTRWMATGELLRTDATVDDYAPTAVRFDRNGVVAYQIFELESPFNNAAMIDGHEMPADSIMSDSAFVSMLQTEVKSTEFSLAQEIQLHIEALIEDESVSESTREIVSFLYGEVVFEEESQLFE